MLKKGFKPVNRYVYIHVPEPEPVKTESGIVLPENFKPTEERHLIVRVLDWAHDVRFKNLLSESCKVIVDKSMIEQFNVNGKQYNVIQDNYIIGVI